MPSGGKGGSSSQITGYKYSMAVHMGISRGPINELTEIRVGDLQAWSGSVTFSQFQTIDKGDLFGGDQKEGGISGTFKVFMGEATQTIDSIITDNIEGNHPVPGWRGVTTIFYYGQIASNNPYPKPWKMRVRRSTAGWDNDDPWNPSTCMILLSNDPVVVVTFNSQPSAGEYITINGVQVHFNTTVEAEPNVIIGDTLDVTVTNFINDVNAQSAILGDALANGTGNVVELRSVLGRPDVSSPSGAMTISASGGDVHAMNPAHIIYECATNNEWGRGLPASFIDESSFIQAANTLFGEGFGLCLRWNREDDIDKFVQTVINHIGAVVYIDRQSGLLTLKLIRDDYDADALPAYTFENGLIDIT